MRKLDRCYYSCTYAVMRKLDAIIRVRMLLFQTSMLLFVSMCCYAKARCCYSCLYAVIPNRDAIIRVSNYVRLNPSLQRARPLWSGASDKLIMPILPAERKFMLLSLRGNRPFAGSGHMVRNKLHWDANDAVGLPKQKNSYQSSPTFLCFKVCVPV